MSMNNDFYSEAIKTPIGVEFSIFTNKDIKRYSAVKNDPLGISVAESYDNYEPKKGGLVDLRLGTCDPYLPCSTCGLNSNECPGHFGHTELAEPVFNYGFLNHLKSVLQCVCLRCSNILIDKTSELSATMLLKKPKKRFLAMRKLCKNVNHCHHCGVPVPNIKKEIKEKTASVKILVERNTKNVNVDEKTGEKSEISKKIIEELTPRDCYNILRLLSNTDASLLGFNTKRARPEDLIMIRFPIPPVSIRPTAKIDFQSSSTMENSLTLKIADIIHNNNRVRKEIEKQNMDGDESNYKQDIATLVQYHVSTYYDNESVSLPKSEFKTGGKPTKSIKERLSAKTGRVRGNLMGKRVDFSGRSVITSDPYIDIDQLGVPLRIAKELTVPEEVTPYNIKYLSALVRNGRDKYPGANFVKRTIIVDGKKVEQRIDLKFRKKDIKLQYGYIVERHMLDDDYVLFNRQPTLHRPSMMGHRVQILNRDDCNTFRMNVSVTKPYNADFDGDEMNIHLAQSYQARNELKMLANAKYQIILPKDSSPIIGCLQDTLSGAYMLSTFNTTFDGYTANMLLANTSFINKINIDKNKIYTGAELFSKIIPKGINRVVKKDGKIIFEIRDGEIITGILDKKSLSTTRNSIVHYVWDKYGADATQKFIDDSQRLILNYLMLQGQTVGFKDTIADKKMEKHVNTLVKQKMLQIRSKITQYENDIDKISKDIIEEDIAAELGAFGPDIAAALNKKLDNNNFFYAIINSGAKGKINNIQQIMGCVGQINVEGVRVKKKVQGRTLSYFHRDDDSPEARGFINNNYVKGLEAYEMFIQTIAGRAGLIDTAIKTARTGYIQRKLCKGLEELRVQYDGTVRGSNNIIVQFCYGENGINQLTQTQLKLNLVNMSDEDVINNLILNKNELALLKSKTKKDFSKHNKNLFKVLKEKRNLLRESSQKNNLNYKLFNDTYLLPVNIYRLVQEYTTQAKKVSGKSDLDPEYIMNTFEDIMTDDTLLIFNSKQKLLRRNERQHKDLFYISLLNYISPKIVIFKMKLNKELFNNMIVEIRNLMIKSIVEPGEMVGILSAQSIGEPTTQFTLDTKHSAGADSKTKITSGVARVEELLHYSKKISTPIMNVYFDNSVRHNKDAVTNIAAQLNYLNLSKLIDFAEIFYDMHDDSKYSTMLKNDNVSNPFFVNNAKASLESMPFVFRLKLNLEKILDNETNLLDVKTKFISYWFNKLSNLKNIKDKGAKELIKEINKLGIYSNNLDTIHIRMSLNNFNTKMLSKLLEFILNNVTLKGVVNIQGVTIEEIINASINKDNGIDRINEYKLVTSGISFADILKFKGVDQKRTNCNDIHYIYKKYGIEAARHTLISELNNTFNNGINFTHISVLADLMTHLGQIISIDRNGVPKLENEVMSKASFEMTVDHFVNAALYNQTDHLRTVSSRIMIGKTIDGGTSCFDIQLDTDKLIRSEYTTDEKGGRIDIIPLSEDIMLNEILNNNINIDFILPNE